MKVAAAKIEKGAWPKRMPSGAAVARKWAGANAFTLLEVMIAIAFIGIAMLALLTLHHQNLRSVVRARELTKAALLAQSVMTAAEVQRFPDLGATQGNFSNFFKGDYSNFRWQRVVDPSSLFPDVRQVRVRIFYGPNFSQSFELVEFMHNPIGPEQ
ncbi:MAG: type IV pilus modification PilV family protein, partial [Candidatus Binataceae bacterium]